MIGSASQSPALTANQPAGLAGSQPKGLWFLFGVEVWERFSYYGMRALLILYLTSEFWGMSDTQAYLTYGAYVAFVYMAPVIGGVVADLYLGHARSVKYGCVLIMVGHILLAMNNFFFWGLAFVVVGTGFFKSAMNASIGNLYEKGDSRRDVGYTLFYMAVNLGSFFATLAVPMVAQYFGWHMGFGLAAIGMGLGLCTFIYAQKTGLLPKDTVAPSLAMRAGIIGCGLVLAGVFMYFIANPTDTTSILYSVAAVVAVYLAYKAVKGGKEYTMAIAAVMKMSVAIMVFFMLFEQTATSVILFSERLVDLSIFGVDVSAASLGSLNPLMILLLSPLFAALWSRWNPTVFAKMGLGLILAGAAMAVFMMAAGVAVGGVKVSLWWIVAGYLLITMGELACSPTGLSAISKVSPPDIIAILFGVWGIKSAFSNYFASYIATMTDIGDAAAGQAQAYYDVFYGLAVFSVIAGALIVLMSPWLKRWYNV